MATPMTVADLERKLVACAGQNDAAQLCRRIQEREWQLLFDYCYRRAGWSG